MKKMVLHIKCPDQPGLIARFTGILFEHQANVMNLEQHAEEVESLFYMRIHVDLSNMSISEENLKQKVLVLGKELKAEIRFLDPEKKMNIAIFVTKEFEPLYDLLLHYNSKELFGNISCIISNHSDLSHVAKQFDIPYHHIPINKDNKQEQEKVTLKLLDENNIDLVVLARYMQILSKGFVDEYRARIINIHHGFLPAFKGQKPYHQAWERGVKMIGATAHYVTEDLDEGPIIEQDVISVNHQHSAKEMVQAGRDIERRVLTSAVKAHLEHRIMLHGKRTIIFHP